MTTINKDKYIETLEKLASESSKIEVEITTFDFETVKGIVTKFYIDEYEQETIVIEDIENKYDIEIDFIRDLIIDN